MRITRPSSSPPTQTITRFASQKETRHPPLPGKNKGRVTREFVGKTVEVEASTADGTHIMRLKLSAAERAEGGVVFKSLVEPLPRDLPAGTTLQPVTGELATGAEQWRVEVDSFGSAPGARLLDAPVESRRVLRTTGDVPEGAETSGVQGLIECTAQGHSTWERKVRMVTSETAYCDASTASMLGERVQVWALAPTDDVGGQQQTVAVRGATNTARPDGLYVVEPLALDGDRGHRVKLAAGGETGAVEVMIERFCMVLETKGRGAKSRPVVRPDASRALVTDAAAIKRGPGTFFCRPREGGTEVHASETTLRPSRTPSLAASLLGASGMQSVEPADGHGGLVEHAGFCGLRAADFLDGEIARDSMFTFHFASPVQHEGSQVRFLDYAAYTAGAEARDSLNHLNLDVSIVELMEVGFSVDPQMRRQLADGLPQGMECGFRQEFAQSSLPEALRDIRVPARAAPVPQLTAGVVFALEERKTELRHWPRGAPVWRVRLEGGREQSFMQRSGQDEEYEDDDGLGLASHKGLVGPQRMLPWTGTGTLTLTSPVDAPLPVSPPGATPYVCYFKAMATQPDVLPPLDRFRASFEALHPLTRASLLPKEMQTALSTFVKEAPSLLHHSSAAMSVIRHRQTTDPLESFLDLPLFGPRIEVEHDAFHAVLNSVIKVLDKTSVVCFIFGADAQEAWSRRLQSRYVPSGAQKTKAGGFRTGSHPRVVYQCRGHQATGSFLTRSWEALTDSIKTTTTAPKMLLLHVTARALESVSINLQFIRWGLHYMLRRSQLFYRGEQSDAAKAEMEDMMDAAWWAVRRRMSSLFPGDLDAAWNCMYGTNQWMMRSFHSVGHCIREQFKRGWPAMDATTTEDVQTDSREGNIDGHSVSARSFQAVELERRLELKRREELRAVGGYPKLAQDARRAILCGKRGHRGFGRCAPRARPRACKPAPSLAQDRGSAWCDALAVIAGSCMRSPSARRSAMHMRRSAQV